MKIEEVGNRNYNVKIHFTYYNKRTKKLTTIESIVHFEVDENGKIVETCSINIPKSANVFDRKKSYSATYYKNQIRGILNAEEQKDFQKVYNYFSPKMTRYWNIYNRIKTELQNTYNHSWSITSSSKNDIEKIEEVRENIFYLYTDYSFFNLKTLEEMDYKSVVRFEFGDDGKVVDVYGLSSERIYPQKQNLSETTTENNKKAGPRDYPGKYLYFTFIEYQGIDVPIRTLPNVNSEIVYTCPKDAKVFVLDNDGKTYYRVYVNGYYGYISKRLL